MTDPKVKLYDTVLDAAKKSNSLESLHENLNKQNIGIFESMNENMEKELFLTHNQVTYNVMELRQEVRDDKRAVKLEYILQPFYKKEGIGRERFDKRMEQLRLVEDMKAIEKSRSSWNELTPS